jgi:hypothetical protein
LVGNWLGVLGQPEDKVWELYWKEAQPAARRLNIDILPSADQETNDLESSFAELRRRVEAVLFSPQAIFAVHHRRVIELEALSALPAIHEGRNWPEAGSLMSYGPAKVTPATWRTRLPSLDKVAAAKPIRFTASHMSHSCTLAIPAPFPEASGLRSRGANARRCRWRMIARN